MSCAVSGQKTPDGYYNLERMLHALVTKNEAIVCCGACLDARGLSEEFLVSGVKRGTMGDLSRWTSEAEKVVTL